MALRLKSEFPIDAQSPAQNGHGRTSAPQLAFIQAVAIGEFDSVSSLSQQAPHLPASQPHFQCPSWMQFLAACGYGPRHPTLTPRLSQWVRAKRVGIDFGREVPFPGNGLGFRRLKAGLQQGARLCAGYPSSLWRWSRVFFRHSVLSLREARALAVRPQASGHRLALRDLAYAAAAGPSNREQRPTMQREPPISAHHKKIRYRHRFVGDNRGWMIATTFGFSIALPLSSNAESARFD